MVFNLVVGITWRLIRNLIYLRLKVDLQTLKVFQIFKNWVITQNWISRKEGSIIWWKKLMNRNYLLFRNFVFNLTQKAYFVDFCIWVEMKKMVVVPFMIRAYPLFINCLSKEKFDCANNEWGNNYLLNSLLLGSILFK